MLNVLKTKRKRNSRKTEKKKNKELLVNAWINMVMKGCILSMFVHDHTKIGRQTHIENLSI